MKFIPPLEIASKIMTLIVEAENELILVSPYVKINEWDKMKKSLSKAVNKSVPIIFIVRQGTDCDLTPLRILNIKPILVKDLHAKVYINDKYAIVTSQNVTHYSDINSIDIAYQTENEKERIELIDFVNQYITELQPERKKINRIYSNKDETIKTIPVKKVSERINYDNKKHLKDWQLPKLFEVFNINFRNILFKKTSSYIFSDELFPFADLILDSHYEIKIEKRLMGAENLVDEITLLNFDLKLNYKIVVLTSHKTHFYIEFMPKDDFIFNDLAEDYLKITNKILKSDFVKNF